VPAVPHTLTGKRLEVPVKRLIQGVPLDRAVNRGAVDRPDVLPLFAALGQRMATAGAAR
jgi:acetoacetyl-CoA synthetase